MLVGKLFKKKKTFQDAIAAGEITTEKIDDLFDAAVALDPTEEASLILLEIAESFGKVHNKTYDLLEFTLLLSPRVQDLALGCVNENLTN